MQGNCPGLSCRPTMYLKWPPQTVFSLSCFPSSVHHHPSTLLFLSYFSTHLSYTSNIQPILVFLPVIASRQCHSGVCTADGGIFPCSRSYLYHYSCALIPFSGKQGSFSHLNFFYLDIQLWKTCKGASITLSKWGHSLDNHFRCQSLKENVGSQW